MILYSLFLPPLLFSTYLHPFPPFDWLVRYAPLAMMSTSGVPLFSISLSLWIQRYTERQFSREQDARRQCFYQ